MADFLDRESYGLTEETEIIAFSETLSGMMSLLTRALQDRDFPRAMCVERLLTTWFTSVGPVIRALALKSMSEMTLNQVWEIDAAVREEQAAITRHAITAAGGRIPPELLTPDPPGAGSSLPDDVSANASYSRPPSPSVKPGPTGMYL